MGDGNGETGNVSI